MSTKKRSPKQLRGFLAEMLLIRRFEEKVEERFRAGELAGFLHACIGQEAVAVGVCQALADGDVIASTHRAHGHVANGTPPSDVNLFIDHSQIVQLECLRAGIWGTEDTWGRMLAYRDQQGARSG
jgi:TPP-dependent pyruvate/acetoin dehydrogenase alpha subunit